MKPLSISLKNYKSYGDNEVSLRLDIETVRLIIGKSGSGKTSIVDAIIWCLYGKSLANSDDVVNRKTKKNCKVEFTFSVGNDEFSVIRYRKHDENGNKVLIFKNNKNISPVKITDSNQLVQDIIEISYNAFVSSIIFSGEIYSSFMREKNSVRLNVFEGILSLRQVNKWAETSKKLAKPLIEKISELETKKESALSVLESIKENIDSYKSNAVKTLNEFKEEKSNLYSTIQKYEEELKELNSINIEKEIEKSKKKKEQEVIIEEINSKIAEAKSKLPDLDSILVELNSLKSRKEKISKIDPDKALKDIEDRNRIDQEIIKLTNEKSLLESQIINVDSIDKEINKLRKRIDELNKEIEKISHDLSCPTCGQDLSKELADELGLLEKRNKEKQDAEDRISELDNNKQESSDFNKKNSESIANIREQIKVLEDNLEGFKNQDFTADEIRKIEKEQSEINTKIKLLEQDYENKEERAKEINGQISHLENSIPDKIEVGTKFSQEYLEGATIRLAELSEGINSSQRKIEVIDEKAKTVYDKSYVESLEEKVKKLKTGLTKLEKDLEKKEYEKKHYVFLSSLFSNNEGGIKKFIIGQMIGVFNDEVNRYLPLFFNENIQIEFDKNLIETIKLDGQEVDFNTFSSGEKTRFEFAIAFSLFMLVKNFFSKDVNFIVFDEILDMNLDEESLERVLGVVKDLGDSNAILIVSHRSELRDVFTDHILVSKDKSGLSVVKEA